MMRWPWSATPEKRSQGGYHDLLLEAALSGLLIE